MIESGHAVSGSALRLDTARPSLKDRQEAGIALWLGAGRPSLKDRQEAGIALRPGTARPSREIRTGRGREAYGRRPHCSYAGRKVLSGR
ncbi:hypothetical protein SAMN06264365_104507 [Actinoplanes regularis]|uniref:Uncharacterized protein n=1 Tax=Actinoplanes regularis TaxID=52697 RepID=A0A238YGF2_9ACTN|nr:hypothetical protein Are01nite_24220 [Actinoplanes regularis]SNR69694.1 hypothetical protein SAMN06264365_104507 [Actinoplanes regularis]